MKTKGFFAGLAALALMLGSRLPSQIPAQPASAKPQLVILDTDIGDDIDDAFALALALHSPELHLLGITTEFGDTELRARLLDRYLRAVGRTDIPVAAGVGTPASNHFTQAAYAQQEPDHPHRQAVDFLLGQIRAHPGAITLIAIGPLVNVQAAIARDPATFKKLKRVVMMGGSVYRGYDDAKTGAHRPPDPEWNIVCDPAGAQALLASGVPVFMMPLDSTQVHLDPAKLLAIVRHNSPLTQQLTELHHEWAANRESPVPTLFDPVAVTYAFHPDLCPARPMRLAVDERGLTRPVPGAPNANVCLRSDENGFLALLMTRILE
ncbi:MAG TPA: nucleoside hydrolase [Terracidiphilus sp.]